MVFVLYLSYEKNKNKQKDARFGPFLKNITYSPILYQIQAFAEFCVTATFVKNRWA